MYVNNKKKMDGCNTQSCRPPVIKHNTVRDTVVHVLTEEKETEWEKTGATINSISVMRGERRGHRETERMERK